MSRPNQEAEIQRTLDIRARDVQVLQIETLRMLGSRFGPLESQGFPQYVRAGEYVGNVTDHLFHV